MIHGAAVAWIWLAAAILSEVAATSALKLSDGLSRPVWVLASALGYTASFGCLALAFRHVPLSIAYAIWAGAGIALVTCISFVAFGERPSAQALAGIVLIVAGILVLRLSPGA
ncbi:DMT family transporter [Jannaschia aquimarina]|uniref:EmrE protein n=1 Tax=Jannaschia aquimarina TaxID=935700 RepID=A0A0D1EJE7_9RHOB|nr:multidrug efflux SMR transporter [Jannaschia aquimarina]KIT17106.1 Multidrug transporter EmrE [Jannaschia aquimarina]SNS46951.1 small multidrug resistance pump [Jannaschia aquimarina]